MASLRDRLRARPLPSTTVYLPADPAAATRLEQEAATAEWQLEAARARGSIDVAAERARVAQARAALDGLPTEPVLLRAVAPAEWEALVDMHPATEEQRAAGHTWNVATFRPALLAASVVPPDGEDPLTDEDWAQLSKDGAIGVGELSALYTAAVNLNWRGPASAVGKG